MAKRTMICIFLWWNVVRRFEEYQARYDRKAAEVLASRNSVYGAAFESPGHLSHQDRLCVLSDELLMQQTNSVAKSRD